MMKGGGSGKRTTGKGALVGRREQKKWERDMGKRAAFRVGRRGEEEKWGRTNAKRNRRSGDNASQKE